MLQNAVLSTRVYVFYPDFYFYPDSFGNWYDWSEQS